jgi:hypothetical protein
VTDRVQWVAGLKRPLAVAGIALLLVANYAVAQNLGAAPQTNVAVQGETGAKSKGAFLNFINRVSNALAVRGGRGGVARSPVALGLDVLHARALTGSHRTCNYMLKRC